ncbi:unnamed protein product [Heligmosomoides polygyrus]|uniref:NADH-ubiquinone oxidoreductase subunit B14.5a n=1 Tax=Heligmosomoides polygyrus TaxID=6339 RepID=A0A183GMX0_HELPZ|nr:unnamed protein product [Heligmosomoides polygyrus]
MSLTAASCRQYWIAFAVSFRLVLHRLHYFLALAYTALGRTITEIKARNTESPFPERDVSSRIGSRVGTPIDLGVPAVHNGNASLSRPRTPYRADAERDKFFNEPPPPPPPPVDRPYHLISNGNLSSWRRIPVEEPPRTPSEPPPARTNGESTSFGHYFFRFFYS